MSFTLPGFEGLGSDELTSTGAVLPSYDSLTRVFRNDLLSNRALLDALPKLCGETLVCHCTRSEACHGDVITDAIRGK